jgi:hypothetical protein
MAGVNVLYRWGRTAEDVVRALGALLPQSDPSHAFCAFDTASFEVQPCAAHAPVNDNASPPQPDRSSTDFMFESQGPRHA